MEQKYKDDTFLARWLNKDLSEEERIAFEKTHKYKEYAKIIEKMELFKAPEFDKETTFKAIQDKINKQQKVRKLVPNWVYSVAASVVLLVGLFYFFNKDKVYKTSYGQQLAVVLPDGSEVLLNAKSKLMLSEKDWHKGDRSLSLQGEGYFKVKKGSKFRVTTAMGTVSVFGTEFNVKSNQDYFDVKCFEGKVSVQNRKQNAVLTAGTGYFKIKGKSAEHTQFNRAVPAWISGESVFESTPLRYVIQELEKQYELKIDAELVNQDQLFSGSFTNKNKEIALQTVFIPLQIVYSIRESGKVTLSEQQ